MRRVGWLLLVLVALAAGVVAATTVSVAVNLATEVGVGRIEFIRRDPWWWTLGATAVAFLAACGAWWTQRRFDRAAAGRRIRPRRPSWVVDRPDEVRQVIRALHTDRGTAAITTGVYGAGGFGKSTVAQLVRADRRVRRRFGAEVYWVTVGRDVRAGALAEKVNRLVEEIAPGRMQPYPEVWRAAENLLAVLDSGPRRLVIVDDVWFPDQLDAFPPGRRSVRLVTTRSRLLVDGLGVSIKVDQMSEEQARAVLTAGLPHLSPGLVASLLAETGRWPLLLRLINRILAESRLGPEDVLHRLRGGISQVDDLTGTAAPALDLSDPEQRVRTVRATLEASLGLLAEDERERVAELAVFARDEAAPLPLVEALWAGTCGMEPLRARTLRDRLEHLALITTTPDGAVELHDVVRDYLSGEMGEERLCAAHRALIVAARPADGWWVLPESSRYLWDHLVEHLIAAGDRDGAGELAVDLRWVAASLQVNGPAAPMRDMAVAGTDRSRRLRQALGQVAHLLAPTDPAHSLTDILYQRLGEFSPVPEPAGPALISDWPLADRPDPAARRTLTGHRTRLTCVAVTADGSTIVSTDASGTVMIRDADSGRLIRTFTGVLHTTPAPVVTPDGRWLIGRAHRPDSSAAWRVPTIVDLETGDQRLLPPDTADHQDMLHVAVGRDSGWLAAGYSDGTIQIWDLRTDTTRRVLTAGGREVTALAAGPGDGLAVASPAGAELYGKHVVRVWDVGSGEVRHRLHFDAEVRTIASDPAGAWVATVSDATIRFWDLATRVELSLIAGPDRDSVRTIAVSPDGAWVAASLHGGAIDIWNLRTGARLATLSGHSDLVNALAFAPDSAWLATGGDDCSLRTWQVSANARLFDSRAAAITGPLRAVAVTADGESLVTAGARGEILFRYADHGYLHRDLGAHAGTPKTAAVAPDGSWAASVGGDGLVKLWDVVLTRALGQLSAKARAVAIAPDGTWLVTGGFDRQVRIWDAQTRTVRSNLTDGAGDVNAVAVSPDGTWVAAVDRDGGLTAWDVARAAVLTRVATSSGPMNAMAIEPGGKWLVTGGSGTVRRWDTTTWRVTGQLRPRSGRVSGLAVAPDGDLVAAVCDDGTVQVFEAASGRALAMTRIDQAAHSCVWDPKGRALFVAGEAGLFRFTLRR
ncbi:WD40 repeat domain-containing protein [Actinoplanes sp. NPDC051861]|uniref:WD40 repeat domain-containing protein n=1 Tax=Actinoplanes sp. NPDC051861 TaxID=3155170 RepID=UPI0034473EC8